MEQDVLSRSELVKQFIRENLLVTILACSGLMLLIIGLISLLAKPQPQINFEQSASETKNTDSVPKNMVVDIEGAVIKPGIYSFEKEARIKHAIDQA